MGTTRKNPHRSTSSRTLITGSGRKRRRTLVNTPNIHLLRRIVHYSISARFRPLGLIEHESCRLLHIEADRSVVHSIFRLVSISAPSWASLFCVPSRGSPACIVVESHGPEPYNEHHLIKVPSLEYRKSCFPCNTRTEPSDTMLAIPAGLSGAALGEKHGLNMTVSFQGN